MLHCEMNLKGHLLLALVFLPFFPILENGVFIAMVSSLLIDIDHVYILIVERNFSWKRIRYLLLHIDEIYRENREGAFKNVVYVFHTVEFMVILLLLAPEYSVLWYVLLGFMFHIVTDVIHHAKTGMPVLRWLFFLEFVRIQATEDSRTQR